MTSILVRLLWMLPCFSCSRNIALLFSSVFLISTLILMDAFSSISSNPFHAMLCSVVDPYEFPRHMGIVRGEKGGLSMWCVL